jgi:predicted regulator of Ras-like GTPase activity (Roadblock/LC7/MglB family)
MDSLQVEGINKELAKFESVGGILGLAVVDENGLTIFSRLPRSIEERKFGAMAATILGAMETAIIPFGEDLINLTIEFEDSQLIIMSSDNRIILVVLMEMEIDLGFMLLEIEEILSNINNILRG